MPPSDPLDTDSLPYIFQSQWINNPDPTALPFPRDSPPFPLTPEDWHQLSLTDADFTPHTWASLTHLISTNQLNALKRWPSSLKAYLAWTAHIKQSYGSITNYILSQRLGWTPLSSTGAFEFHVADPDARPLAHKSDYAILRNDWTYAFEPGVEHLVVWSKIRLPVDAEGGLTGEGRQLVEGFVAKVFRGGAREQSEGEKVQWFKNTTVLQSVRALEHFHVVVRGVESAVVEGWLG